MTAGMDAVKKLEELELEHKELQFNDFTFSAAKEIGLFLIKKAEEEQKSITVDVTVGKQQIFHCALKGTSEENDRWIIRKNRVVDRFQRSSYSVGILLKSQNKSIEEVYGLSADEYAPYGGSYPIMVKDKGFIGTITISGLRQHEDHEMVVEAIKWYLGKN
jgi:uncharacterized protein (UPF0303 family)